MLNGIDLAGLNAAKAAITAKPEEGDAQYGVFLQWLDGTRIVARSLDMRIGETRVTRDFTWTIDEPPQLLGQATGPTPQEYLMSGVAACIIVGFVVNASIAGVAINQLSVTMEGSLDLAGFLNLRPDAKIPMRGLTYAITVQSSASEREIQEIADKAFRFSPNAMTVATGIPVEGTVTLKAA